MGELRNLTEENVEELKVTLNRMQKENPDLEYWFFPQKEETESDTLKLVKITEEIKEKLDSLERKLNLIFDFDGHVLVDGALGRHLARKWKLRI